MGDVNRARSFCSSHEREKAPMVQFLTKTGGGKIEVTLAKCPYYNGIIVIYLPPVKHNAEINSMTG